MPPGRPGPRTAAHHPPRSAQRGGPPQAPADVPGGPGGSRPRTPNAPQSARGAPLASQGRHAPEATALAAAAARPTRHPPAPGGHQAHPRRASGSSKRRGRRRGPQHTQLCQPGAMLSASNCTAAARSRGAPATPPASPAHRGCGRAAVVAPRVFGANGPGRRRHGPPEWPEQPGRAAQAGVQAPTHRSAPPGPCSAWTPAGSSPAAFQTRVLPRCTSMPACSCKATRATLATACTRSG